MCLNTFSPWTSQLPFSCLLPCQKDFEPSRAQGSGGPLVSASPQVSTPFAEWALEICGSWLPAVREGHTMGITAVPTLCLLGPQAPTPRREAGGPGDDLVKNSA